VRKSVLVESRDLFRTWCTFFKGRRYMRLLILYDRTSGDWNKPGQSGVVDV
jgi:hypothetical protein